MSGRVTGGAQPHPLALELTGRLLGHAADEDWRAVGVLVDEVFRLDSSHALLTMLYAAADIQLAAHENRVGRAPDGAEVVEPVWVEAGTGRVGGADDVPPAPRWAGRFIAARAAGDRQQCEALIRVLAGLDPQQFGEHVLAVIESCAAAVRAAGPCRCGRCRS